MEWIVPLFLSIVVFSAVVQLFWSYAMSVIAAKGGQSDLMQVLAWVPILQIFPMIVAGGGSIQAFLLGAVGLLIAAFVMGVAAAVVGGGVGGAIGGLGFVFLALILIVYFGRISWTTAADRGLSGWVGLLVFIPIVNLFIYPFIAFHDGWESPNLVGLAIGLVLALGSTAPSFQTAQQIREAGGLTAMIGEDTDFAKLFELAQLGSQGAFEGGNGDPSATASTRDPGEAIRVLFEMQGQFETLQQMSDTADFNDPAQKQRAVDLLRSIEVVLQSHRDQIDSETYGELAANLVAIEGRVHGRADDSPRSAESDSSGRIVYASPSNAGASKGGAPGPAALGAKRGHNAAPIRPIPVQPQDGCPAGTTLRTKTRDRGEEEWCQQSAELGGLRHGWFARYHEGGQPEAMGEYAEGLRVGVWTRFYPSGKVRAQAEFEAGLQEGWMLAFDEEGNRTKAVRFTGGSPAR